VVLTSCCVAGRASAGAEARDRQALTGMCKRRATRAGGGVGQLTKMVQPDCIAGLARVFRKAFILRKVGARCPAVIDTHSEGPPAQSWQMEERWKNTMNRGNSIWLCGGVDAQGSARSVPTKQGRNGASLVTALVDCILLGGREEGGTAVESPAARRLERELRATPLSRGRDKRKSSGHRQTEAIEPHSDIGPGRTAAHDVL